MIENRFHDWVLAGINGYRLTYRRVNHDKLRVRGYREEGATTTPFVTLMLNGLDRFHLVADVIDWVSGARRPACRTAPAVDGQATSLPRAHPGYRRGLPGCAELAMVALNRLESLPSRAIGQ